VNNCLFSKECDNICSGVTGCRTFCNNTGSTNSGYCNAYYSGSTGGEYTCVNSYFCQGDFLSSSNNFFIDCSQASNQCKLNIDSSGNSIVATGENAYSIKNYIKCQITNCDVTATYTQDLYIDCS
jgi:hypothetical protein